MLRQTLQDVLEQRLGARLSDSCAGGPRSLFVACLSATRPANRVSSAAVLSVHRHGSNSRQVKSVARSFWSNRRHGILLLVLASNTRAILGDGLAGVGVPAFVVFAGKTAVGVMQRQRWALAMRASGAHAEKLRDSD